MSPLKVKIHIPEVRQPVFSDLEVWEFFITMNDETSLFIKVSTTMAVNLSGAAGGPTGMDMHRRIRRASAIEATIA